MQVRGLDNLFLLEPAVCHLELRNRGRRARSAELEAPVVEPKLAADRPRSPIRPDLQRPGHARGQVVAVQH